ncbi:tRNA isopentenyltransferase [Niveomyces insectorum RCEF 264]|uniref:tRNA isopentenyltransferase n=1 Tax=Niveomyces insectorum RCEF 264 TaxID=1081102 RepID=A0A167RVQ3_9HYPO|nr:tRNA isopentenyltransferase [Niveomyces insectorum RCEF 264]
MARPLGHALEPLVVVLGSTGTGKSDLAVELACQFNGEIINADAMQMYRGLPVTTNKIATAEQRGVPHHLLGTIGLDEPTWRIDRFKQEATRTIRVIRERGRLPIVVGGSQYYTDGLLFEDRLVVDPAEADEDDGVEVGAVEADAGSGQQPHAILDGPTEDMLARLRDVDPVMADRWHPNDRRKIRRSLEIYLTTGRRASDIYAEQRRRQEDREREREKERARTAGAGTEAKNGSEEPGTSCDPAAATTPPWPHLLFWVYTQPDVLDARLDARIDTMLARGLVQEAGDMYDTLQDYRARGVAVDRTKGIWQSIGFKEMEPYVAALKRRAAEGDAEGCAKHDAKGINETDAELARLKHAGLDGIKFGTRRYARYQLRWIKHKTIPLLRAAHALDRLYLLDSTDKARWQDDVAAPAVRLTAAFLELARAHAHDSTNSSGSGRLPPPLPAPVDLSETARTVLTATIAASRQRPAAAAAAGSNEVFRQTCEVCRTTHLTEDEWTKHIKGHRHRRVLQKQKRRALVPVLAPPAESEPGSGGNI